MYDLAKQLRRFSYVRNCNYYPKRKSKDRHQIILDLTLKPTAKQVDAAASTHLVPPDRTGHYAVTFGNIEPYIFWNQKNGAIQFHILSVHDISNIQRKKIKDFFKALRPKHLKLIK